MRRLATLISTVALVLSSFTLSPAHADVPADGTYPCTTGEIMVEAGVLTTGTVSFSSSCGGAVVIPSGVTAIADQAFFNSTSLTSITIPASVTSIGEFAFYGALSLTTVTFASGSTLTNIGFHAFSRASSLTSITIPASVTSMGGYAFNEASSLTAVTFAPGSQLTSIGDDTFFGATSLTSIAIPASVTSIGVYGFYGASSLASVTFSSPSQLVSLGEGAFRGASSLSSIEIPASVTTLGPEAFLGATSLTSITFAPGSQLMSIGDSAFGGDTALTSIAIPSGVTTIGNTALFNLPKLASIYFLGNEPTVTAYSIGFAADGAEVYVKVGATGFDDPATGYDSTAGTWQSLLIKRGYLVTYEANGATGGELPSSATPIYESGESATVATNTGALVKTGYSFAGWNTQANGLGTNYASSGSATLTMGTTDVTLYAKWTKTPVKATASVKPTVLGTASVGKTLTVKKGTWAGYPTPTFTYQWYACTKAVTAASATVPGTCKKITGATKTTFKILAAQKTKYVAVQVNGKSTGTAVAPWLSKTTAKIK